MLPKQNKLGLDNFCLFSYEGGRPWMGLEGGEGGGGLGLWDLIPKLLVYFDSVGGIFFSPN